MILRTHLKERFNVYFIFFQLLILISTTSLSWAVNITDKETMDKARAAFENGQLNESINLYEKIPQSSDFWVEALEEKSWAHLRKNDPSKALAHVTTLTSDLLAPQIGPEPYFLKALINYKLCHIQGILEDFQFFKTRYKEREGEIKKLTTDGTSDSGKKALSVLKSKKESLSTIKADDFGIQIQYLPRYFYRDKTILFSIQTSNEDLYKVRLAQLAKEEVKEVEDILQKMHLLESQVVQQVFAYNKEMQKKKDAQFSKTAGKNELVFPYNGDSDIWIDEIDSFEAATAECPVDPFKGAKR